MRVLSFIAVMRPHQWLKNLLLFFPPFFAGKMPEASVLTLAFPAFLSFSLAASSAYIINDIKDIEADRRHKIKKNRMIARGDLPVPIALLLSLVLYVFAMLAASSVSREFEWFIVVYLIVSFLYTFFFKDVPIFDIFFVSFCFLVRVLAGGEAFKVTVTKWLFLTVFIVSIFLAAGKRLAELISLGDDAHMHRKILAHYSPSFLGGILWFSASAALVTYALYTLEHPGGLFYTVPLVTFGLLRYIYIVQQGSGDPTEAILKDRPTMGAGILWLVMISFIIYGKIK